MLPANFRCIAEEPGPSRLSLQLSMRGGGRKLVGESFGEDSRCQACPGSADLQGSLKGLAS